MVQIPVLALPTPFAKIAHGVYCDEFAEFQFKDMPGARTARRLHPLQWRRNRVLASRSGDACGSARGPGLRTRLPHGGLRKRLADSQHGAEQKFIPIHFRYRGRWRRASIFPGHLSAGRQAEKALDHGHRVAVLGISLGTRDLRQLYWFWRDRKSLIGNPVTPLMNVLSIYGAAPWMGPDRSCAVGAGGVNSHPLLPVYAAGFCLQVFHTFDPGGLFGPGLWLAIRLCRSAARRGRELDQLLRDTCGRSGTMRMRRCMASHCAGRKRNTLIRAAAALDSRKEKAQRDSYRVAMDRPGELEAALASKPAEGGWANT